MNGRKREGHRSDALSDALKGLGRRREAASLIVTAMMFALYCTLPYFGAVPFADVCLRFLLYSVFCAAVCLILCKIARYLLPKMHWDKVEAAIYEKCSALFFFLLFWGILLLGWIPAYLAFFPGIFGYDTPNQMQQIMGEIPYSQANPLTHTLLLSAFMKCGNALFGTYNGGVALFCIFQGLVLNASIAYSFLIMRKLKTPFPILIAALAWCVFHPVLQVLACNTTKDILFGAVLLHFLLRCYGYFAAQQETFGRRQEAALVTTGFLLCLLRNQGIYLVLALAVCGLIVLRTDRRFAAALFAAALFGQLFFSAAAYIFGIQRGDMREMLSVPIQQMALVCSMYMEGEAVVLTEEEFEAFSRLVEEQYIPDYHLSTADPIKAHFDTGELMRDLPGYIGLYLRVGMHNPGFYMTAFRCLIYPYWDMAENIAGEISINNTFPEMSRGWGISQESLFPSYKAYLTDYIRQGIRGKMPVVSWFAQPGLCIWVLTALFGMSAVRREKAAFVTALAGLLFLAALLFGPVALLRYLYPLMITMPFFLALLCNAAVLGGEEREKGVMRPADAGVYHSGDAKG